MEIINGIKKVVSGVVGRQVELSETTSAKDVKGWDSLSHIQIIAGIEKHFQIKFTSTQIIAFKNVGDIVQAIISKTQK